MECADLECGRNLKEKGVNYEQYTRYSIKDGYINEAFTKDKVRIYMENGNLIRIWLSEEIGPTKYTFTKLDI